MSITDAKRNVAVILLLVHAVTVQSADSSDNAWSAKVDPIARAQMEEQELVGLAIGIVQDGRLVYARGYGMEDREAQIPVTRETMFRWASISKPVTAVAAMMLVEQGKLDLDVDVRSLVPEFPDKGVVITPRQLLGHQGGIVHYTNGPVIRTKRTYDRPNPFADVVLALDTFKESPLLHPPGSKYAYTTHGFILLSAVVERAAGEPFAKFVDTRIAGPAGMTSFRPDYQWESIPHRAVGYIKRGPRVTRSIDSDVSWKLGGGGFISTIDDLALFGAALVNHQWLEDATYREMWSRQTLANGKPTGYGLGFFLSRGDPPEQVWHGGSQDKTRTHLLMVPSAKSAVAVMSNSENCQPQNIAKALLPLVLAGREEAVP